MKIKQAFFIISLLFFFHNNSYSQNRNSVWCFGDSAGIDFSSGIATPIVTSLDTRGSCVSMADTDGSLLFYANTRATLPGNTTRIWNHNNQLMQNGDSIVGEGWYQELVTFPSPANDSTYYLFSISVIGQIGLVYSIIDMRLNNGLGAVVTKNIMLQSFEQVDCLNAVKHGNGRDWWVIFRKSDVPTFGQNNDWYTYLVTPTGVQNFSVQSIGSQNRTNNGHIIFNSNGTKLLFSNLLGVIEQFNFDRCTGQLSNPITIEQDAMNPPFPFTWGTAYSPDDSKLYVTTNEDTSYLFQYDLNASNIAASKDTLWTVTFPNYALGGLKLGPDGKIYLANLYYNPFVFFYPYADSMYFIYNMNLSVINQPDSLGNSCNLQPYSFYLGGKRTYIGLPNNPDYEMGPLLGSPCDTLLSLTEQTSISSPELFVYYASNWQTAFINAQKLKGHTYSLSVYDLLGNEVFKEAGKFSPPYFTKNLNCGGFGSGVYVVRLQTESEFLTCKFIIQ